MRVTVSSGAPLLMLLLALQQVLSVDLHDVQEKQLSLAKRRLTLQSTGEPHASTVLHTRTCARSVSPAPVSESPESFSGAGTCVVNTCCSLTKYSFTE